MINGIIPPHHYHHHHSAAFESLTFSGSIHVSSHYWELDTTSSKPSFLIYIIPRSALFCFCKLTDPLTFHEKLDSPLSSMNITLAFTLLLNIHKSYLTEKIINKKKLSHFNNIKIKQKCKYQFQLEKNIIIIWITLENFNIRILFDYWKNSIFFFRNTLSKNKCIGFIWVIHSIIYILLKK